MHKLDPCLVIRKSSHELQDRQGQALQIVAEIAPHLVVPTMLNNLNPEEVAADLDQRCAGRPIIHLPILAVLIEASERMSLPGREMGKDMLPVNENSRRFGYLPISTKTKRQMRGFSGYLTAMGNKLPLKSLPHSRSHKHTGEISLLRKTFCWRRALASTA